MSRDLSANLLGQIEAESLQPFIAVEIVFSTGVTRAWSGYGQLYIDSNLYLGVGTLGNISQIPESSETKASGIIVTLSGIPNDVLAAALRQGYQGRPLTVYMGALSANSQNSTRNLIGDPIILFKGITDTMNINQGAETTSISISVENRLIDLERPRVRRYTSQDQKLYFPNDKGLDFVTYIQEREIPWGVPTPA